MKSKTQVATVILAGLAAGAAIYYLMSTEKGRETRDKWADNLKDVGESLKDLQGKALDAITQLTGRAEETAEEYAAKAKKYKNNAKNVVNA